ncbi:PID-CTERM protein-sorting domain-containing protein [Formosa sp. S-31]|uniref:PID-CTERM protein-sorting domain-containing protein n=1 Tax=Formosa sp. S-31 TaxID=2790949 RepID=UPI003EB8AECD
MRKKTKIILPFLIFAGIMCFAQNPPQPDVDGRLPPPPGGLPIDGGIGVLLVVGAYYGVRKSMKK